MTGLAFGIATAFWLRYMYNTPMAEITLTIVATYGTYIVADELFHVSAVLAVVTLGALRYISPVLLPMDPKCTTAQARNGQGPTLLTRHFPCHTFSNHHEGRGDPGS